MIKYKNLNGNSGVDSYDIGENYIDIKFSNKMNVLYRYSIFSTSLYNINNMKKLAIRGYGLNKYINQYVKDEYERIIKL